MGKPQEMKDPVVIRTFDPNLGAYYACYHCRTHIALEQHLLPDQPEMEIDDRAFSEAINVLTNSPAEDHILNNCTVTNAYCSSCNLILGTRYIQVEEGYERPIVGEFVFSRVGIFDPDLADYYTCLNCRANVALQLHTLPIPPEIQIKFRSFSEGMNVSTNSPDEDYTLNNVTCTNIYCNTCDLILGVKFIQVPEGLHRPIVNEVVFDRPRLMRIAV